ncbi:MAG: sigma-70 family RNA polymerase sigma factor [Bacteroidota bacterium]
MSVQVKHNVSKPASEEHLILLLKSQDKRALELIFDNYSTVLLNVISRIVKDRMMAQDVLQESLLKVWNHSATYKNDQGSLFTWLVTICRNTAIDKTRTKDFRLTQESRTSPELVFIEKADENDEVEQWYTRQLINQLPPNQRNLIDLAYFQGFTQREIAENLEIPLGTVKTRIRLALAHLRSII